MTGSHRSRSAEILETTIRLFEHRGTAAYLGEPVTMAEHMLQAAWLAEQETADDELVAAALLHDIGHFAGGFPSDAVAAGRDNFHENTGAALLEPVFSERLTACVRHHVAAKRYLCAVEPAYFATLSQASVDTLALQGGPMCGESLKAFRALPWLADILRVRRWDDAAKVAGRPTPPLSHFVPRLRTLAGIG